MAALIIPSTASFGALTNQNVSRLIGLATSIPRLQEAVATAASGYDGTPGTEYEAPAPDTMPNITLANNFMVQPDPKTPGANGVAYAYAVGQLTNAWQTFWEAAKASIEQLDNGGTMP